MAAIRHLDKAPITEALIDLRVALTENFIDKLKSLAESVSGRFPKRNVIQQGQVMLKFAKKPEDIEHQLTHGISGFICSTEDETRKVQFRLDGFTFNKLKPYETWERMRDEAKELWNIYAEQVAEERPIQRIALRYINHLDIPYGTPLEEYLTVTPPLPDRWPQVMREYLNRVVVWDDKVGASAIVTQQAQPVAKGDSLKFLLDIDVVRENANLAHDRIGPVLETFHEFKNLIFFESITEKTVEIYQ